MSTLKLSILIILCVITSACSQFQPFEDRRREPGTEYVWLGASKPEAPVICYNPLFYRQEKLLEQADALCRENNKNSHAELRDIDYFSCRLLVPAKAYYKCVSD